VILLAVIIIVPGCQGVVQSRAVRTVSDKQTVVDDNNTAIFANEARQKAAMARLAGLNQPSPQTGTSLVTAKLQDRVDEERRTADDEVRQAKKQMESLLKRREEAQAELDRAVRTSTEETQRLDTENKLRLTIVQAVGGLFVLVTAIFTGLNWYIARQKLSLDDTIAKNTKTTTETTLRVTQDKQASERFVKATENLGHGAREVRLGAIYSLERLARDSASDYPVILKMLAGFIRVKTRSSEKTVAAKESTDERSDSEAMAPASSVGATEAEETVSDDVQAALDILSVRKSLRPAKENKANQDSSEANGASDDLVLNLNGSRLNRADLTEADLCSVLLNNAELKSAAMRGAEMRKAKLIGANLRGADMGQAKLNDADLSSSILIGVTLIGADLTGADLTEADLTGANLTETIGLTQEQLDKAFSDGETLLPDGLYPPPQQTVSEDEAHTFVTLWDDKDWDKAYPE
jgi:hypothetical protein